MTREEILSLPAGKPLDLEVARALGWRFAAKFWQRDGNIVDVQGEDCPPEQAAVFRPPGRNWITRLPAWSIDPEEVGQLLLEMTNLGAMAVEGGGSCVGWSVTLKGMVTCCPSLPETVARAFVLASLGDDSNPWMCPECGCGMGQKHASDCLDGK